MRADAGRRVLRNTQMAGVPEVAAKPTVTRRSSSVRTAGRDGDRICPRTRTTGHARTAGRRVFLTDMIGFHLDMGEEAAPDSVASAYMLVMEHLMLFTPIRLCWG